MRGAWVVLCLLSTGCLYAGRGASWSSPPAGSEKPLAPVPDREKEFADVPVPRGFVRDSRSWSRERGTFRMCSLLYHGGLDPFTTSDFMNKQMELAGWRLLDKSLDNDQKFLNFSKASDRCRVSIWRMPGDRETHLSIGIDPQGMGE